MTESQKTKAKDWVLTGGTIAAVVAALAALGIRVDDLIKTSVKMEVMEQRMDRMETRVRDAFEQVNDRVIRLGNAMTEHSHSCNGCKAVLK